MLVTGGAGFVGSHIVDGLIEREHEVLVVDDLSTGSAEHLPGAARLEEMGIEEEGLSKLVSSFHPEAIAHCAAQASVPGSMADPALDAKVNIMGGINLCRAALDSRCARFDYITTGGALYGEPDYVPCDEDHPIRPISAYGLSKWTMEQYTGILLGDSMNVSVLRLANVFGPRQNPHGEAGVVAIFGRQMMRGDQVTIFGDGEQTRDFVYVKDVVRAHELAMRSEGRVTVNIGSGVGVSVNDLFRAIVGETYYARVPVHEEERPGDVKHVVLANGRAKELLGWEPQTSLVDGLRETLGWIGLST